MKKRPVKKQSSSRLSRIAAKLMRLMRHKNARAWLYYSHGGKTNTALITGDVLALAASVLSQDETKGQGKAGRKK